MVRPLGDPPPRPPRKPQPLRVDPAVNIPEMMVRDVSVEARADDLTEVTVRGFVRDVGTGIDTQAAMAWASRAPGCVWPSKCLPDKDDVAVVPTESPFNLQLWHFGLVLAVLSVLGSMAWFGWRAL